MSTYAQTTANRDNADSSTGPRSAAGKATSSRNAEKHGLFSMRDFVRQGEEEEHNHFRAAFLRDLQPEGALELTLAGEIFHAAWRLRRCSEIEARLAADSEPSSLDPMEDEAMLRTQNAVDRARNQANRLLLRATGELRRLQTERQTRNEILPAGTSLKGFGLAECRQIGRAILVDRKVNQLSMETIVNRVNGLTTPGLSPESVEPEITKQSQSVPRSAPCPCGSGQKYKRCCGKNAPAVLGVAA